MLGRKIFVGFLKGKKNVERPQRRLKDQWNCKYWISLGKGCQGKGSTEKSERPICLMWAYKNLLKFLFTYPSRNGVKLKGRKVNKIK